MWLGFHRASPPTVHMIFDLKKLFGSRETEESNASEEIDPFQNYDFKCDLHLFHYGELEGYLPSFDPACLSAYVSLIALLYPNTFLDVDEIFGIVI